MPSTILKPWVSPEIIDQVLSIGLREVPNEACGIITPDSVVVQLPNSSTSPTTSYIIAGEDLVSALNEYIARVDVHPADISTDAIIVWHTHPSGNIGPSKGDMDTKVPGFRYVVITLPGGEASQF